MLEATRTPHAPWTLVSFNDQRCGRLTLIRHLLDRLPDVSLPEPVVDFPLLAGRPKRERFLGPPRPIRSVG
jgi:hypothetical protein